MVSATPPPWSGSPLFDPQRPARGQGWPSAAKAAAWMVRQAAWVAAREPVVQALVSDWNPHRSRLNDLPAGPLRGMLAGIKDIFHADGLPTRGGTSLPVEALSGSTGNAVRRLVRAGAMIAAKTVTTEFAYFEPGPTTNPWHASRTPGGSSSGSAAGVAAGFFDVALGTQTVGSVIRPAAFCGVPGYKPTLGTIRRDGLLVFSRTVDHVGLFSRTWEDMLAAANALSMVAMAPPSSKSPVLGLVTGPYAQQASGYMRGQVSAWCERMEQAGFQVREVATLLDIEQHNNVHRDLTARDLADRHQRLFADFSHLYRPRTAALIEDGMHVDNHRYAACLANRAAIQAELRGAMVAAGVDLLVSPAAPDVAPAGLAYTGDPVMNLPWTHAGVPVATFPIALDDRVPGMQLPVGVQVAAGFGRDSDLLHWSRTLAGLSEPWLPNASRHES